MNFARSYATITIICITATVFILQIVFGKIIALVCGLNAFFMEGFYWQPLTTMFVHGNFMHIAMNMAVLFQFGNVVERAMGTKFFLLSYFGGGIATSLLTYVFIAIIGANINVVGASGAICVIIGFIAQRDTFNRRGLIIAVLLISFVPLLVGMQIAWYSHIIGFGVGWAIGRFL